MARILLWDIEASNLVANIGNVLCIGYKWYGEKTKILSVRDYPKFKKDPTDDRGVVKDFREIFCQADMHVTWYGTFFDLPFIRTRLLDHNLPPLPEVKHLDGWYVAKKRLKLHSNRLATVQDFLQLPSEKTPLSFKELARSRAGHIPSLKSIEHHCLMDVEVLEQAYDRLKSVAGRYHPNLAVISGDPECCPTCGSSKVQSRGWSYAQSRAYRRFQCNTCHGWFRAVSCDRHMSAKVV